jgi:hypothetical protein
VTTLFRAELINSTLTHANSTLRHVCTRHAYGLCDEIVKLFGAGTSTNSNCDAAVAWARHIQVCTCVRLSYIYKVCRCDCNRSCLTLQRKCTPHSPATDYNVGYTGAFRAALHQTSWVWKWCECDIDWRNWSDIGWIDHNQLPNIVNATCYHSLYCQEKRNHYLMKLRKVLQTLLVSYNWGRV